MTSTDFDAIIDGKGSVTLIQSNGDCSLSNLASKLLSISQSGKKRCEKLSATTKLSSDSKLLTAVFKIDKSGCKTYWWIILVSVLAGVLLIAIIVLILVFTLVASARKLIRPFSGRRKAASNQ